MIKLIESENDSIVHLHVTADCECADDLYSDTDECFVSYEANYPDISENDIEEINSWNIELDDGSICIFKLIDMDCYFNDKENYKSGMLEIDADFFARSLTETDKQYIAEVLCDFCIENVSVNIKGECKGIQEYYDPYASDYRGEREVTYEVNESSYMIVNSESIKIN